jgi:hypothetical protein
MDTRENDACPPESDNVAEGKTNMDLDETPGRVATPKDKSFDDDTRNIENLEDDDDTLDEESDNLDDETNNEEEEEDAEDVNYKLYNENNHENGDTNPER